MPHPVTTIGPLTLQTYTLLLGLGILAGMGLVVLVCRRRGVEHTGATVDVCLAGLVGGVLMARAGHVALHWSYFQLHPDEMLQLSAGGLNWHGAVLGALAGVLVAARVRRVNLAGLLDGLALALPVIAFTAWWGCGAAHCAHGAEVDNLSNYPAALVWEARDVYNIIAPRYATQSLGMAFSGVLLAGMIVVTWMGRPHPDSRIAIGRRGKVLWLALGILAAGMFLLGFLRGDDVVVVRGLRLDQWLDALMMAFSLAMLLIPRGVKFARV